MKSLFLQPTHYSKFSNIDSTKLSLVKDRLMRGRQKRRDNIISD